MPESSVWDFLRSKLANWLHPVKQGTTIEIGSPIPGHPPVTEPPDLAPSDRIASKPPWRALLGLLIALLAQRNLEMVIHANSSPFLGMILFTISAILIAWGSWRGELVVALPLRIIPTQVDNLTVRVIPLITGFALGLLTFLSAANNRFTILNVSMWSASIVCLVYAFWIPRSPIQTYGAEAEKLPFRSGASSQRVFSALGVIVVVVITAYFRFNRLAEIPGEMNSDHAEKILDIIRLLEGQTNIFFPNNGGREALQMYLVAGLQRFFGIPVSFMTLKTISSLAGFLALPFVFLLGQELANRRAGLLAMAFFGVAYWPNVVSRLGLRLPFYILFTAATLYFLARGLHRENRNDFIWLGLVLGLSLYGYTADRILPVVVLTGLVIYLLHNRTHADAAVHRQKAGWYIAIALMLAFVIALPMLRYAIDQPDAFLYRTLTRISGKEQALADPAMLVFLQNTGHALAMFSWSNGDTWTTSVPNRPALDITTGALFWSGFIVVLVTYLQKRRWQHIFLLLSIPILMLPSIMALAFPNENPNLYRTGGTAIPVFMIIGLGLDSLMTAIQKWLVKSGKVLAWSMAALLFFLSAYQSHDLVFNQYRQQYALNSWNSSEMGQVVRNFVGITGKVDNIWVMGYPHWVDTRLVGMVAGYPLRDFALFSEDIQEIPTDQDAKLFVINPKDLLSINVLQQRYPQGVLTEYPAKIPGKEFLIFFVPEQAG